jgi:hypothetical protein
VHDPEVPGGRFLVPGCYNRALNGDEADCHCDTETYEAERMEALENCVRALTKEVQMLRRQIEEAEGR